MSRISVAILYGGKSGEHDVSIMSAASVYKNLDNTRYEITPIGISRSGCWYLQDNERIAAAGDLSIDQTDGKRVSMVPSVGFYVDDSQLPIDVVFPVLHGSFGEDGTVQGALETVGVPYVGAGVLGSAVGINKVVSKKLWQQAGLPVVPFLEITAAQLDDESFDLDGFANTCESEFGYPCFVKPASAGSSVGVTKADTYKELKDAIAYALVYDTTAMVEPMVSGREVECSAIGNHTVVTFVPGEIVPSHEFYSYEAKYIDPEGALLRIPADISDDLTRKVKALAEKAYRAAYIDGMARVDFFVKPETNEVLLNEVNTIPGFTDISMFSQMCEKAGLPYSALLDELIDLAMQRFRLRANLKYER